MGPFVGKLLEKWRVLRDLETWKVFDLGPYVCGICTGDSVFLRKDH